MREFAPSPEDLIKTGYRILGDQPPTYPHHGPTLNSHQSKHDLDPDSTFERRRLVRVPIVGFHGVPANLYVEERQMPPTAEVPSHLRIAYHPTTFEYESPRTFRVPFDGSSPLDATEIHRLLKKAEIAQQRRREKRTE